MMDQAIRDFAKQFKFRPKIEGGKVKKYKRYIIAGMGGSHLAGDVIKSLKPELDIVVHSDYGLPGTFNPSLSPFERSPVGRQKEREKKQTLLIVSSYSGNTEETIDALETAFANNLPAVAIATGGKLLEFAKARSVPYIQVPDTGIQPRSALGFSVMAMLKVMKQSQLLKEASGLSQILRPQNYGQWGKQLAERLGGRVPVIYASARNYSLVYNWKIKFNETGKIPAFCNVFPELNHNEMTGWDVKDATRGLAEKFYFLFLSDDSDPPKLRRRMEITAKLYRDRGLPVEMIPLRGESAIERIFNSLLLADWAAYYTAENYGLESEQVPMVEELKKLIV